jgi:hypothetical protein
MLASHTAVGTRLWKVSESPRATRRTGDASQTPHIRIMQAVVTRLRKVSESGGLSVTTPGAPVSHKTSDRCGALGQHERVVRRAPSRMSVGTTESARTDGGPVCHYTSYAIGLQLSRELTCSFAGGHATDECSGSGKTVSDSGRVNDGVCALGLLYDGLHIRLSRTAKPRGPLRTGDASTPTVEPS